MLKRIFPFSFFLLLFLAACAGPAATLPPTETGSFDITVFKSPT
jgi:hypothetical protein